MKPSASTGARAGAWRAIALLALAQSAVFLLLILFPPEELSPGGFPYTEEWRRGLAAREWMIGPLFPYSDYVLGTHTNGTALASLLAVPSFALFGSSVIALRLPNLLFWWGALACVFLFVDRAAGRRAAWFAGLFAVAASPCYQIIGAAVWASHIEGNTFILWMLVLWQSHVFGGQRRDRDALLLGFAAGLGNWYHYAVAIWYPPMLAIELMLDRRALLSRRMGLRLAGWIVGFLPWILYNATHDWEGIGMYGMEAGEFARFDPARIARNFVLLWWEFLPGSLHMPDFGVAGLGRALDLGLMAFFSAAWLALAARTLGALRRGEVRPELALVLYPPLWTLLYCAGSLQGKAGWLQGYRYMIPLHPIGWMAAGIELARLGGAGAAARPIWLARALCGGVAALLLAGVAAFLRFDRFEVNWNAPGWHKEGVGSWLFTRRGDDAEALKPAIAKLLAERDPLEADMSLFILGNSLMHAATERPRKGASPADLERLRAQQARYKQVADELFRTLPPRFKPYFASLRPTERPWHWVEREEFWKQWDQRGVGRPPGAFAH